MRFILAIFAVWFAILLVPEKPHASSGVTIREKVWLSRTCPDDSRWYLDEADDQSVTVACYVSDPDGN